MAATPFHRAQSLEARGTQCRVVPPLFSRHRWSNGVRLAATVGFKGVGNAMGLERRKKMSRSARYNCTRVVDCEGRASSPSNGVRMDSALQAQSTQRDR
eukprot:7390665-Prymnesium_polylepis.2